MKRNTLTTAVLAGLTGLAGMASVANAVNVNPDGLGQVLLYPYYSARGGNDTLISIVNTTERGKAVKIRFIEALNSREVLDFNIYMSPFDVWTGAVTGRADSDGGKLTTFDATCKVPAFGTEQEFLTFAYAGGADDGGPQGEERTASGYIEVIEMGTMVAQPVSEPAGNADAIIPWSAKHVDGVPRDCARLQAEWTDGTGLFWEDGGNSQFGFDTDLGASGGLFGSAAILNVADGTMLSYNATAIDGFYAAGDMFHSEPDSLFPDLSSGTNSESFVFDNGTLEQHTWPASLLAVNASLTLDTLMNEYVTADSVNAQTEWVLTLPTKRFHVDPAQGFGASPNDPIEPFTRTWHVRADGSLNKPCEDLEFRFYDREERVPGVEVGPPIVSPAPPPGETPQFQLCKEANVVRFASDDSVPATTEILKEPTREGNFAELGYTNFQLPYTAGWVLFDLAEIPDDSDVWASDQQRRQSMAANDGSVVEGLPIIGFQATTYTNGTLDGGSVLANYGGTFNHRGSRSFLASAD